MFAIPTLRRPSGDCGQPETLNTNWMPIEWPGAGAQDKERKSHVMWMMTVRKSFSEYLTITSCKLFCVGFRVVFSALLVRRVVVILLSSALHHLLFKAVVFLSSIMYCLEHSGVTRGRQTGL